MRDVSRRLRARRHLGSKGSKSLSTKKSTAAREAAFPCAAFRKPRDWRFQTKPLFKKIRGPLVDVFHEAREVLIVMDLGGFRQGDVSLTMMQEKYLICAKRGDQEFRMEIELPPEVDIEKCVEHFRNGVLEIVLPRKRGRSSQ
jgi:HSP20 family molecular chaperone IbpA